MEKVHEKANLGGEDVGDEDDPAPHCAQPASRSVRTCLCVYEKDNEKKKKYLATMREGAVQQSHEQCACEMRMGDEHRVQ